MLRYVSKWVRQTLVILGMLLGLSPVAFAQTSLENGTYTLSNNVTHDNPVGQGMARSYTEEQSDLVVSKDGLWLTLGFNNTQYMGEFTIKVNGSQVSYEVVYNSNNIKKLKFKIPSLDATISVGMYVVTMNTEVEYTVTLNQGSLKLVEKEVVVEEVKPEEPVTKPESSSGSSSQTESNTQNNNQTVTKPSTSTQAGSQSSSQSQGNSQTKPEQSPSVEVSTVPAENSTQTQMKVEEETNKVDGQVEISEKSEQEDVVTETEELISEEAEAQEPEVEKAISEIIENQEAAEETIQEETVKQEKGSLVGIAVVIIAVIVLVGGVYYWYIKIRK